MRAACRPRVGWQARPRRRTCAWRTRPGTCIRNTPGLDGGSSAGSAANRRGGQARGGNAVGPRIGRRQRVRPRRRVAAVSRACGGGRGRFDRSVPRPSGTGRRPLARPPGVCPPVSHDVDAAPPRPWPLPISAHRLPHHEARSRAPQRGRHRRPRRSLPPVQRWSCSSRGASPSVGVEFGVARSFEISRRARRSPSPTGARPRRGARPGRRPLPRRQWTVAVRRVRHGSPGGRGRRSVRGRGHRRPDQQPPTLRAFHHENPGGRERRDPARHPHNFPVEASGVRCDPLERRRRAVFAAGDGHEGEQYDGADDWDGKQPEHRVAATHSAAGPGAWVSGRTAPGLPGAV